MDPLLEHFMPSLMALKKALPGRQPEVLGSHLFLLSAFIKFKNKKIEGNLKTFSQKRIDWKLCIGEVRVDLEHLCLCS